MRMAYYQTFPRRLLFGAALLLAAAGLAPGARAADEPKQQPAASGQASTGLAANDPLANHPCFKADASIKEVLDACAAYIASDDTDTEHLIIAHGYRAQGLSSTGDLEGAIGELDAIIKLDPERASAYLARARAETEKKQYEAALADIDKTVSFSPDSASPYVLRARIYKAQNKNDEALKALTKAVELNDEYFPAFADRGVIYREQKQYDKAEKDFSRVVALQPNSTDSYLNRGWLYVVMDELDKADKDFQRVLAIQAANPSAIAGRGVVKSRQGKPTDGSADLHMAQKLDPEIFDKIRAMGVE